METVRQLPITFEGRAEVRGYSFRQIARSDRAYIYEVTDKDDVRQKHYEVFEHIFNQRFNCISYPGSSSFGLSAWCMKGYERAKRKFDELNNPEIKEVSSQT